MVDELVSVKLITALSRCWSAIRLRHPDVPGVVLLPAPSPTRRMNVLGHFAPVRWRSRADGQRLMHEVVVVAEHLNRTAEDVFETLLHEAAHAVNCARGVKDCSATSQYHNKHFRDAAEELGLWVGRVANYGYAFTQLTRDTREHYRPHIRALELALIHRRGLEAVRPPKTGNGADGTTAGATTTRSRSRKATCACGFIIRVSKKTIEDTTIRCDSCGGPFQLT